MKSDEGKGVVVSWWRLQKEDTVAATSSCRNVRGKSTCERYCDWNANHIQLHSLPRETPMTELPYAADVEDSLTYDELEVCVLHLSFCKPIPI